MDGSADSVGDGILLLGCPVGNLLGPVGQLGRELGRSPLELSCAVIEFGYPACQLRIAGGHLLGPVAQLSELVGQILSLAADLVERGPQRTAGAAQPLCHGDCGVLSVGEALADLRRELVSSELVLYAAQGIRGVACQWILAAGELIDHRGQ